MLTGVCARTFKTVCFYAAVDGTNLHLRQLVRRRDGEGVAHSGLLRDQLRHAEVTAALESFIVNGVGLKLVLFHVLKLRGGVTNNEIITLRTCNIYIHTGLDIPLVLRYSSAWACTPRARHSANAYKHVTCMS